MVSKAENNEQIDADILQGRADVLRARDIVLPSPKKPQPEPKSQKTGEDTTRPAEKEKTAREDKSSVPIKIETIDSRQTSNLPVETVNHPDSAKQYESERETSNRKNIRAAQAEQINADKKGPVGPETVDEVRTEIPRFDLAADIMAEQRKITAARRKAPGEKITTGGQQRRAQSIADTIEQPMPALSEQEQIIAEIVARDIAKLCGDDDLADSI